MTLQGPVTQTSASSLTLTTSNTTYVYTGSTAATWTLPAVSGNTGVIQVLINRSAAGVTVQRAGSDNINNENAVLTSVALGANSTMEILNDGTYWVVTNTYTPLPAFDATANSGIKSGVASGTAVTWTHTVAAGLPYGVIVLVSNDTSMNAPNPTAVVTFGGVTCTSLGYVSVPFGGSDWVWMFGANSIPSGSQTVSVKLTSAGGTFGGIMASYTYLNVSAAAASTSVAGTTTGGTPWYIPLTLPRTSPNPGRLFVGGLLDGGPLMNATTRYYSAGVFGGDAGVIGAETSTIYSISGATSGWQQLCAVDLLGPPSLGPYYTSFANGNASWRHSARPGDYVIVAITSGASTSASSVTYGGSAMTALGSTLLNNSAAQGDLQLFGISNVTGGLATVAATISGSGGWTGTSVSYGHVTSVSSATTAHGSSASLSNGPFTLSTGQVAVNFFASNQSDITETDTGSTILGNEAAGAASGVKVAQALSTNTFTGTATSGPWAAVGVILS